MVLQDALLRRPVSPTSLPVTIRHPAYLRPAACVTLRDRIRRGWMDDYVALSPLAVPEIDRREFGDVLASEHCRSCGAVGLVPLWFSVKGSERRLFVLSRCACSHTEEI